MVLFSPGKLKKKIALLWTGFKDPQENTQVRFWCGFYCYIDWVGFYLGICLRKEAVLIKKKSSLKIRDPLPNAQIRLKGHCFCCTRKILCLHNMKKKNTNHPYPNQLKENIKILPYVQQWGILLCEESLGWKAGLSS